LRREADVRLQILSLCKMENLNCQSQQLRNEYQNLLFLYQLLGE